MPSHSTRQVRANERLATVLEGAHEPGDREMTIGALREASRAHAEQQLRVERLVVDRDAMPCTT